MRVVALRQLHGNYGLLAPGEDTEIDDDIAVSLINRGLASEYVTPTPSNPVTETKVTGPEETKPRRRKAKKAE